MINYLEDTAVILRTQAQHAQVHGYRRTAVAIERLVDRLAQEATDAEEQIEHQLSPDHAMAGGFAAATGLVMRMDRSEAILSATVLAWVCIAAGVVLGMVLMWLVHP